MMIKIIFGNGAEEFEVDVNNDISLKSIGVYVICIFAEWCELPITDKQKIR